MENGRGVNPGKSPELTHQLFPTLGMAKVGKLSQELTQPFSGLLLTSLGLDFTTMKELIQGKTEICYFPT